MKQYYDMIVGERAHALKRRMDEMLDTYGEDFIEEYARKVRARNAFDADIALGRDMRPVFRGQLADVMLDAMIAGDMSEFSPFTKEQMRSYVDDVYLPEAKRVYSQSVDWFATNLRAHAPDIAQMIEEAGGNLSSATYNGAEDNYRIFEIYDNSGMSICLVYYDYSAQAFDVDWLVE